MNTPFSSCIGNMSQKSSDASLIFSYTWREKQISPAVKLHTSLVLHFFSHLCKEQQRWASWHWKVPYTWPFPPSVAYMDTQVPLHSVSSQSFPSPFLSWAIMGLTWGKIYIKYSIKHVSKKWVLQVTEKYSAPCCFVNLDLDVPF